ncbi:MAG: DUF2730 family protein [Thermoleophilaceae bacterium]
MEQKPPQQPAGPGGPQSPQSPQSAQTPPGQTPSSGEPGAQPAAGDPASRPATVDDLKGLRRWVIVAGIWAVAASAIGLIALLSNDNGSDDARAQDNERVSRALGDLDKRLDKVESQVNGLATSEDVQKLEGQLNQAQDDASSASKNADAASKDVSEANSRIDDLESKVEDLESSGGGSGGSGSSP